MIDIDTLLAILGAIVTIAASWGVSKYRIDALEKALDQQRSATANELNLLAGHDATHDRNALESRLEIEKELGKLRLDVANALARLKAQEERVAKVEERIDRADGGAPKEQRAA